MTGTYSIKDLEKISGIKAHTLRIWEQRYNILEPKRTPTNIRYYDSNDLKRLLNICILNCNGVKISKISRMSKDEIRNEVVALFDCCDKYENQVNALTLAMLDLEEDRFENIVNKNVLQIGFEDTMQRVIYPFFERVGILWQTGTVSPAQEHFVSNLIRQKLIVAIDGQVRPHRADAPKYLLFLPEGELHELSLLFGCYLLKSREARVVYLGQSVPLADIPGVIRTFSPDYVFTMLTAARTESEVQSLVHELSKSCSGQEVLIAGRVWEGKTVELPGNVQYLREVNDLLRHLQSASSAASA